MRSQAVYHGIAEAMQADDEPVLVLCSPDRPYVSIGMHQDVQLEIDRDYCARHELPIIRRQVGGGSVLLDEHQLFFQFVFPRQKAPRSADELYPYFIEPAVRTYQSLGIPARYQAVNDIQVDGKKIGGTGAASIGNATVMVGSFLLAFDAQRMASLVRSPSLEFREVLERILAQNMTSLSQHTQPPPAKEQLGERFLNQLPDCLGCEIYQDSLRQGEQQAIAESEIELLDPDWLNLPGRKFVHNGLKISADTYLIEARHDNGLRCIFLQRQNRIADILFPDEKSLPAAASYLLDCPLEQHRLQSALTKSKLAASTRQALQRILLDHRVTEAI